MPTFDISFMRVDRDEDPTVSMFSRQSNYGSWGGAWWRCRSAHGEGDDLVPIPKELDTVAAIKTWRENGLSLRAIAAKLTDAGVPTKLGGCWWARTVSLILTSEIHVDAPKPSAQH